MSAVITRRAVEVASVVFSGWLTVDEACVDEETLVGAFGLSSSEVQWESSLTSRKPTR